jgi:2,3-bisphosphoglycerate-dependent phosphoglycerate mutase
MKKESGIWIVALVFALLFTGCNNEPRQADITEEKVEEPSTLFYILRHAEKAIVENDPDPLLSEEGFLRAERLKRMLWDSPPDVIFSSDYQRNYLTAKPLADALGIEILRYDPRDSPTLVSRIFQEHPGKKVLIIGHSNTVPGLVNILIWEDKFTDLDETEYSKLFVVKAQKNKAGEVLVLNF